MTNKLTPILLPTEDASPIVVHKPSGELRILAGFIKSNPAYDVQHLYLVSDEPIKEGDKSLLLIDGLDPMILTHHLPVEDGYKGNKIILTTDPKLIADGVPAIDGNTKALVMCPICEGAGFNLKGYTYDCQNCKAKKNFEVNFLTEFCKRWNNKGDIVIEYNDGNLIFK